MQQPYPTFQRVKSQKNWLLKTHPEAYLGNPGLLALISGESRAATASQGSSTVGSLLAVGEVLDLRSTKSSRVPAWPVVAMAAGEAGHVLHLFAIDPERWTWNDSWLPVGAPQHTKFQGSWANDGSPISQIKFATKRKQYDTIRWFIIQKETSTTIFEPVLRAKPVAAVTSNLSGCTSEHIATNPIVTLTADAIGGESHCHFSINLGSDGESAQLAILHGSGNWSVWNILRDGHGRSRTTKAVLRRKGWWTSPWNVTDVFDKAHIIIWISRSGSSSEWERDSTPSEEADLPFRREAAYVAGINTSHTRQDGLLICNSTQVRILDAEGKQNVPWLDFSRRDHKDALLDAQAFPGSSSYVLLLTTDRVYLLDVSEKEGQEGLPPRVMLSCRHFRRRRSERLKMSTFKPPSLSDTSSSLVLLHSPNEFRVDVFWFTISQQDGTAHFHHQVVQLPDLETMEPEDSQGIESLAAVPLQLSALKGKNRSGAEEDQPSFARSDDVEFYQLFALSAAFGLSSSVIAVTRGTSEKLSRPSKSATSKWGEARWARFLRQKLLREGEQAFVVPDELEVNSQLSVAPTSSLTKRYNTVELRFYFLKLVQELNRGFFGEVNQEPVEFSGVEPFSSVREALQSRDGEEHISLKPLLRFSDPWQPLELAAVEDEWNLNLKDLGKSRQAQLFECGRYIRTPSVMDVFEKVSTNWSARLAAESLKASQWRYMELALERMAAELYLSETGVYAVSQSTSNLASKSVPGKEDKQAQSEDWSHDLPSSQLMSSQALPTPSATPSSSRATSETVDNAKSDQDDEDAGREDPAVARLRMYLPSIKFTPPPKNNPLHVMSLWPEHRGVDPLEYQYIPFGKGSDEMAQKARRRKEREEERRRRRAERRAQMGVKMEGAGEPFSQPLAPTHFRSSPVSQEVGSSQAHSQGFGLGFSSQDPRQSQSFGPGFGFSQIMSQPLPGEFGGRPSIHKKKGKVKPTKPSGFK